MILTNPVLIGVVVMCALCLVRFNVLLAILVSAILTGLVGGLDLAKTTSLLISGMSGNLETALSYVLLGALAAAVGASNLTAILVRSVSDLISQRKFLLIFSIAALSCLSQNLIPVHIAFIPILIPPFLAIMNKMRIDRRAVACALTFGLQAPYLSIPVGFGLIFQNILVKEISANGMAVTLKDVYSVMWIGSLSMILGLVAAVAFYAKSRDYGEGKFAEVAQSVENAHMTRKEWAVLAGVVVAFAVQLIYGSLPLGGLFGLVTMIVFGGIEYKKIDLTIEDGLKMMAFVAFVMLVAAGFANVIRETSGIGDLVKAVSLLAGGQLGGAVIMLIIGLLVTMGIGTSFGTIPILATIYIPLCISLGFSPAATILLVGVAAAVGDAGSPASDSTLGPTSGLNADGKHNHIYDTCVPTFFFFNIPMMVIAAVVALMI